jgi:hypothetical protein
VVGECGGGQDIRICISGDVLEGEIGIEVVGGRDDTVTFQKLKVIYAVQGAKRVRFSSAEKSEGI